MKYRQELLSAICLSIVTLIYALMIKNLLMSTQSIANHIQFNFAYMFLFSFLMFRLIYQKHHLFLILHKFRSLNDYIVFEIKEKMTSLIIFFSVSICLQMIIFVFIDPLFNIYSFIYYYIILIWLMSLVCCVLIICCQKNNLRRFIVLFVLWNTLFMVYSFLPNSIFAQLTPFSLFNQITLLEFIRMIILSVAVLSYIFVFKKEILYEG